MTAKARLKAVNVRASLRPGVDVRPAAVDLRGDAL
jgi:hypothetical protein